jgi:hypothetical protein
MLIPLSRWEQVRDHFSEQEREELLLAVIGESIQPVGQIVDQRKLTLRTRAKIELHIITEKLQRAAGA